MGWPVILPLQPADKFVYPALHVGGGRTFFCYEAASVARMLAEQVEQPFWSGALDGHGRPGSGCMATHKHIGFQFVHRLRHL